MIQVIDKKEMYFRAPSFLVAATVCLAIGFVASLADAQALTRSCVPPCRKGYLCSPKGQCVSACNPPCDEGQQCIDGECYVPAVSAAKPAAPPPAAKPAAPKPPAAKAAAAAAPAANPVVVAPAPPPPPPPPKAAPPVAASPKPGAARPATADANGPKVTLKSNKPNAVLLIQGTETIACTIPCNKRLDKARMYYIGGDGVTESYPFRLPEGQSVILDVDGGSSGVNTTGRVFFLTGFVISTAGAIITAAGGFIGLIPAGIGLVAVGGGWAMDSASETHVMTGKGQKLAGGGLPNFGLTLTTRF